MDFWLRSKAIIDQQPDVCAVVSGSVELSWKQLSELSKKYHHDLKEFENTPIALRLDQNCFSVALLFATQYLQNDCILVPDFYPIDQVKKWLSFYSVSCLASVDSGGLFSLIDLNNNSHLEGKLPQNKQNTLEPHICLLTSGTTGTPKCARHSWSSLTENLRESSRFIGKKWLMMYPLAHFAGLQVVVQCLATAGTLIMTESTEPALIYKMLIQYQPHYFNCTPTLIRQFLFSYQPSDFTEVKLENITLGGEVVDQSTINLIQKYFPQAKITHIYASTETGAVFHVKDNQEGFPADLVDGKKVKIIDGQIAVKKNTSAMSGYINKKHLDDDEWIMTKDMVIKKQNRFIFSGRKDDLINVGGFKVSPLIVENIIKEMAEIIDVTIKGEKNAMTGFLIKAYIVTNSDMAKNNLIRLITEHCKKNLPYYMIPRLFEFSDKIKVSKVNKKIRN